MQKTRARRNPDSRGRTKPQPILRRAPRYTDAEKIAAVTTILELGGMTAEAITAIRLRLNSNISTRTLGTWMSIYREQVQQARQAITTTPKPVNIVETVRSTQQNLASDLIDIQRMIVDSIKDNPQQVNEASLRDKMVSLGISTDKLEKWLFLRPGASERWHKLEVLCLRHNVDPDTMFDDFLLGLEYHLSTKSTPNKL